MFIYNLNVFIYVDFKFICLNFAYLSSTLTLAALACACNPSSVAIFIATGPRDFTASLFKTWCVQVFINVPNATCITRGF